MESFTEATYDELNRLLKIVNNPLAQVKGGNELDLDWMLDWTEDYQWWLDRNKGPTSAMIEYWEEIIERGEQ
jgi:hypothetical protein